jgi:predicted glycoside hydrolase/deacetylase ChbG (UPF0249 family)
MTPRTHLIVNADDLGYDPAVTAGILRSMREGVVTSTTCMVNLPHSEEAAKAAGGLAVGLHVNLARGRPLTGDFDSGLLDEAGHFDEAKARSLSAAQVTAETLAQLDQLEGWLGRPATHLDVHKHLHRHPSILAGVAKAAASRGLPVRSIEAGMRAFLRARGVATNDAFLGDAGAEPYWTLARLREALSHLPTSGVVELMCHPGHAPTTLKSGYGEQREVELDTFLHPDARQAIERSRATAATFEVLKPGRV